MHAQEQLPRVDDRLDQRFDAAVAIFGVLIQLALIRGSISTNNVRYYVGLDRTPGADARATPRWRLLARSWYRRRAL